MCRCYLGIVTVEPLGVDTKSTGRYFQLDALTAEKVFGWKNVHKHEGSLVGKKQDKRPVTGDELRCQTIQLIRSTRIR